MIEFRVGALAGILGVHRNTVTNWIKTGRLPVRFMPGKKYVVEPVVFDEFLQTMGVSAEDAAGIIRRMQGDASAASLSAEMTANPQFQMIYKEVPMSDKPVGAVMVVGAGITGIQASLDLADSGYFVYLLEKSPGIGGGMAMLDKTFPTNDCAM
jgi:hypothetical protein